MSNLINLDKKRKEKIQANKVVSLDDYRKKKIKKGMTEKEFNKKYMKNSIVSLYGKDAMNIFNIKKKDE